MIALDGRELATGVELLNFIAFATTTEGAGLDDAIEVDGVLVVLEAAELTAAVELLKSIAFTTVPEDAGPVDSIDLNGILIVLEGIELATAVELLDTIAPSTASLNSAAELALNASAAIELLGFAVARFEALEDPSTTVPIVVLPREETTLLEEVGATLSAAPAGALIEDDPLWLVVD